MVKRPGPGWSRRRPFWVLVIAVLTMATFTGVATAQRRVSKGTKAHIEMQDNAVFLCYSKSQLQPGAWDVMEAPDLIAMGYWPAYALPGNVPGDTNVDGYHLVCNPSEKSTGDFRDHNGMEWSPLYSWLIGIYPGAG